MEVFMTIQQIQWQLGFLGFYDGAVDGIWGTKSQAATIRFQQEFALSPTGLFQKAEEEKSKDIVRSIQTVVSTHNPTPLLIDGLAGKLTMAATVRYQKDAGLTPDGIAGPQTRAAIEDETESEAEFWARIRHFTRDEFACKCGSQFCDGFPVEPSRKLVRLANCLRDHFGSPVLVSSGIRCPRHNAAVGGVANSRHLTGSAMDFWVDGITSAEVLEYANRLPIRYAYAIDENYIHMDV
jgi:uncharacterized protein YcbK (DUF882 family)